MTPPTANPIERLRDRVTAWCLDWRCRRAYRPQRLPTGDQRIYFYHIRKTGGTSINHIFLSLGGEDPRTVYDRVSNGPYFGTVSGDKVFAGWTASLLRRGKYFYGFSHIPQHRLAPLPERTFTLTCLRDPADRILSLYRMLWHYEANNVAHPGMIRQRKWLGSSFSDFLDRIPKSELLNQIYMFSESFSICEAAHSILECSHVMFTEQFEAGIQTLAAKLQYNLRPVHARSASADPPVSDEEMNRLRELLAPEYQLHATLRGALCGE